jgi:hypothetical protein
LHPHKTEEHPLDGGAVPPKVVRVDPFFIDEAPVTNKEFGKFVRATYYETEAEKFGWSFVLSSFLPNADQLESAEVDPEAVGASHVVLLIYSNICGFSQHSNLPSFIHRKIGWQWIKHTGEILKVRVLPTNIVKIILSLMSHIGMPPNTALGLGSVSLVNASGKPPPVLVTMARIIEHCTSGVTTKQLSWRRSMQIFGVMETFHGRTRPRMVGELRVQ